MHLFTEYALSTGAKIDKPFLLEKFYPLPFDKYITIQNSSAMGGKNYDYYIECIQLLKPFLDKYGINVVHLGGKDDQVLPWVYRLCGATNLGQSAYLIKKGLLHLGNDSALMHIASSFDKPIVALFAVSPPEVSGPYFNVNYDTICLEPEFPDGVKYSYNPNENPKMVNTIRIEKIVNSVLKLLNLSERINVETLHIGQSYKAKIIELIPNQVIDPQQFPNQIFNIRGDLHFDPQSIFNNLYLRKCSLVINKPLDLNLLHQLKNNIIQIIIEITPNEDVDLFQFVKQLHKTPIKYNLVTYAKDEELNQLKLKYLDFNQIIPLVKGKKTDVLKCNKISENTYFATNKAILANQQIYPSEAHWRANIPSSQINKVIDNDTFWNELEYHFIYNNQ